MTLRRKNENVNIYILCHNLYSIIVNTNTYYHYRIIRHHLIIDIRQKESLIHITKCYHNTSMRWKNTRRNTSIDD